MNTLAEQKPFHNEEFIRSPFHQRQKLIRCNVIGKAGSDSVRMVELENFRLWEYLMTNKHGLQVHNLFLCLWVCEEEYIENENVYSHAGKADQVNHIVVELYDDEYGFTNTINRFVPDEETDKVVKIHTSHIPKSVLDDHACQIDVVKGWSIEQWQHTTKRPFILGFDT